MTDESDNAAAVIKLDDRHRKYHETLGRFIDRFAAVEGTMQVVLWHASNVTMKVGQAVFSGVRMDAAMALIMRVAYANNWSQKTKGELKYLFDQLSIINKTRNDIVHYGANFNASRNAMIVTNALYAHLGCRLFKGRLRCLTIRLFSKAWELP